MTEKINYSLIVCKVHIDTCLTQSSQTKEHKRDTEKEVTNEFSFLRINQCNTNKECWPYEVGNIKRETSRHNPCRQRRSDVRSHDNRDGLNQRQQSGIHKADRHNSSCC